MAASTRSRITERVKARNKTFQRAESPLLRIGVPKEYLTDETQAVVREAWSATLQGLRNKGHSIHPLSLPATKMALSAYYVIAPAEASSNLARYDGVRYGNKSASREGTDNVLYASTRGAGLGEEVKRRILLGSYSLSAAAIDNYFIKAQKVRRLVQKDFNNVFALPHPLMDYQETRSTANVDVIMTPTAQSLPPKLDAVMDRTSLDAYSADILTAPASLAGLPAISVPASEKSLVDNHRDYSPTVGMQLTAQYGDDQLLLDTAQVVESLAV